MNKNTTWNFFPLIIAFCLFIIFIGRCSRVYASEVIVSNSEIQRVAGKYGISTGSDEYHALELINSKYGNSLSSSSSGTLIFMFEGVGSSSNTGSRLNAMCVVVKNHSIKYISKNSTSIPDYPFDPGMNGNTDMPTLISGIYNFTTVNHKSYAALNVSGAKVVRHSSQSRPYSSESVHINIHRRSSNSIPAKSSGWVNSAGCQLVGNSGKGAGDEYANFIKAVGIVGSSATGESPYSSAVSGKYICDRTYAYNYLEGVGYTAKALELIGVGQKPDQKIEIDSRYPVPFKGYPIATSGTVPVYSRSWNQYSNHYIAHNDLCIISEVYKNGFCKVTYPTDDGEYTAYAKKSAFIASEDIPYNYKPEQNYTTYIRSNMNTAFGSVFTTDNCKVVAGPGSGKYQLIYPISDGYKIGWIQKITIPPSQLVTPILGYNASASSKTPVYRYESTLGGTKWGEIFVDDLCTLNSVNIDKNWINVTYPISGGTKTGYVYLNQFLPSFVGKNNIRTAKVSKNTTVYRKLDRKSSIGTVYPSDSITIVGKSGTDLQILYPITEGSNKGKYKLGWIKNSEIVRNLQKINVTRNLSKTSYLEGEDLDKRGLVITAYYDDGSTVDVTGSCSYSKFISTPGTKTITVTYAGKITAFTVIVNAKTPTSLTITQLPTKKIYYINDTMDPSGLKATASFNNNTTAEVSNNVFCTVEGSLSTEGTKNVLAQYHYNGKTVTATFTVKVIGKEMSSGYNRVLPDGDYMIVSAADPTYYLDIAGGDSPAANGTNVQLYGPNGGTIPVVDTWTIKYSDGFYSIVQNGSNAALDVQSGSAELGANVQAWQTNTNNNQKWAITYFDEGKGYRIQSKCSGMSLDITGGVISAGKNIEMYSNNKSDAQRWLFIPKEPKKTVEDGKYVLVTGLDPHVELDIPGDTGDVADGTNIQIWSDGAPSRYNSFDVKYQGNGYYHLIHSASGKYLEVNGSSTDNYGNIQISAATGNNNQRWCIIPQNGGYMLVNRNSGLIMDVDNGKTADATNVRQHYYNGSRAQTWIFKKAEYSVKYDANGGTGAPAAQTKYYANALTLSASKPSDENREFKGWATDKNASEAQYQPGARFEENKDITLYAVWEKTQAPSVTNISVRETPAKMEYTEGESLDTEGLQIEAGYDDGTSQVISNGFSCVPEVLDKAGTQTITVTYEGKTTTFQVTVNSRQDPEPLASGRISAASVSGSAGMTVAVPVTMDVNPGIIGINLSMKYDESKLTLVKVESGDLLDGSSRSTNYTQNP